MPASAADGVLEINQACALNGGCFDGDAAGFPVTITQHGSYKLTGSLVLTDVNVTAIEVELNAWPTIDLNDFELRGPVSCDGFAGGLTCSPAGLGVGISGSHNVTVRNGTISGFGGGGISLGVNARVSGVRVVSNDASGIAVTTRANIEGCHVTKNSQNGIAAEYSAEIKGNMVRNNREHGIVTGPESLILENRVRDHGGWGVVAGDRSRVSQNTIGSSTMGDLQRAPGLVEPLGNSCDGGCSADGRRLYYMTQTLHQPNEALTACETGFHFASLYEILDPSNLRYDTYRGRASDDSGSGPLTHRPAWLRTGTNASGSGVMAPGFANCNAWTTMDGNSFGSYIELTRAWTIELFPEYKWPWRMQAIPCDLQAAVWCVQD
jgi:hypothetical protein